MKNKDIPVNIMVTNKKGEKILIVTDKPNRKEALKLARQIRSK